MQYISNYMIRPLDITVITEANHKIEITEPYGDLLCWVTSNGITSTKKEDWSLFAEAHKISKPVGYSKFFNYATKKFCFVKLNQLKAIKDLKPTQVETKK